MVDQMTSGPSSEPSKPSELGIHYIDVANVRGVGNVENKMKGENILSG